MTDDDVVYPVTGNEDLVAAGLPPEDNDDIRDDATVLFGVDLLGSGSAPIDLDGGGAGATAIGAPVASNTSSADDTVNLVICE